jgi:Ca2+-binding RTX toxin-like protein
MQSGNQIIANGTNITLTGADGLVLDGGGGAGDSFTALSAPSIPTTVQGVADTVVNGTAGSDNIRLAATANPGEAKVYLNNVVVGTFKPTGHMILAGLGGNDTITADGANIPAVIYGGDGNDTLTGGGATDLLFGGAGDDTITGAAGNDFLIGGDGKDRLVGSAGHDILVSGDVAAALDLAALAAIAQAWAASRSLADATVDDLLDETLGDGNSDTLTGGAGADLFIINTGDNITDFQFGKPKTNKDGDVVIKDGIVTA